MGKSLTTARLSYRPLAVLLVDEAERRQNRLGAVLALHVDSGLNIAREIGFD